MLFQMNLVMLMNPYVLSLSSWLFHAFSIFYGKSFFQMFYLKFDSSGLQKLPIVRVSGSQSLLRSPKYWARWHVVTVRVFDQD